MTDLRSAFFYRQKDTRLSLPEGRGQPVRKMRRLITMKNLIQHITMTVLLILPLVVAARGIPSYYLEVCPSDSDLGNERKCYKTYCEDLDSYGGQPSVDGDLKTKADNWIRDNVNKKPNGYLSAIPKTNLAQDKVKKNRQDEFMSLVNAILNSVPYAYGQYLALGLPTDNFDAIAKQYKAICASKAWRGLGEREERKYKQEKILLKGMIEKLHQANVAAYADLAAAKQRVFNDFAAKNPAVVQTALQKKAMRDLQQRVTAAENNALMAEQNAEAAGAAARQAQMDAANANARAANANARADDATRRANDAQWRLDANGVW